MPKMKTYPGFDAYLDDQSAPNQEIIRALRELVNGAQPALTEDVKWGNGCWVGENGPVAYVHSEDDCVQLGFFRGSSLEDPDGLLEGKGKFVRFIRVREPSAIDGPAFEALLKQAVEAS